MTIFDQYEFVLHNKHYTRATEWIIKNNKDTLIHQVPSLNVYKLTDTSGMEYKA